MILTPEFKNLSHRELKKGELALAYTGYGQSLLLALSQQSESTKAFCIIPFAEDSPPWIWLSKPNEGSEEVLSYGTEWVLECKPDDNSRYGNAKIGDLAGAIVLTRAGPLLNASQGNGSRMPVSINLEKSEIDQNPQQGWPTLDWRIWACEDDRKTPNRRPIYECRAK